jgi:hypothetical protein
MVSISNILACLLLVRQSVEETSQAESSTRLQTLASADVSPIVNYLGNKLL